MKTEKEKKSFPRVCSRCGQEFKTCSVNFADRPEWEFYALVVGGKKHGKMNVETRRFCSFCLWEILNYAGFNKEAKETFDLDEIKKGEGKSE